MALSRMEMYLAIIRVLDHGDSITKKQIMHKAGLNFNLSKEFLNFLVQLDIIKEKNVGPKTVYFLTDKGQRLYTYFGLDDDNPIFRGTEYFESISRKRLLFLDSFASFLEGQNYEKSDSHNS